MKSNILLLLVLPLGLTFCQPKPIEGGEEIAKEAEMRKIQRITPEQLYAEAFSAGDSISATAARLIKERVVEAYAEEGVAGALKHCNLNNYEELNMMLNKYGATISRTSQQLRNPANKASGQAIELLDAYHYNAEAGLAMEPNVQEKTNGDFIYTKAIMISDNLCLNCHGQEGNIKPEDAAILKAAYPTDKATGYKLGDLRGMWQVEISREGLVKNMSLKKRKKKRNNN